jgi:hypothetical protein
VDELVASGTVQRFPGPKGWYYLEFTEEMDASFRPLLRRRWPSLIGIRATAGSTSWDGSILPIKGGRLFIAIPAPVRKKEGLDEGSAITVRFTLRP